MPKTVRRTLSKKRRTMKRGLHKCSKCHRTHRHIIGTKRMKGG